jgi:hypothetical protein
VSCGEARTRTGRYGYLADDELLRLLEAKLGKSPILDELFSRLDATVGFDSDLSDLESKVNDYQTDLAACLVLITALRKEVVTSQLQVECPTCLATSYASMRLELASIELTEAGKEFLERWRRYPKEYQHIEVEPPEELEDLDGDI